MTYFCNFVFHTACLICGFSVFITYGIHFIANMEPWSIGLLALLVISFIVTILLIQRQPQNQQKVAFMVNNLFSMLFSDDSFGWILRTGRENFKAGKQLHQKLMSVQSLVCVICNPLDLIHSINPLILHFHLCSKISYVMKIMKCSDEGQGIWWRWGSISE